MYGAYKAFFIYVHNMTKHRSRLLTCGTPILRCDSLVWYHISTVLFRKKKLNNVKARSYSKLMFFFSSKDCFLLCLYWTFACPDETNRNSKQNRLKATCTNFHLIQPVPMPFVNQDIYPGFSFTYVRRMRLLYIENVVNKQRQKKKKDIWFYIHLINNSEN